jgi:hypothetical protein
MGRRPIELTCREDEASERKQIEGDGRPSPRADAHQPWRQAEPDLAHLHPAKQRGKKVTGFMHPDDCPQEQEEGCHAAHADHQIP